MSSAVPVGLQPAPSLLVRLRPTGPWRIGPDSGDRDRVDRIFHSDALYSAVTGAMARLGHLDEWLDATARAAQRSLERFLKGSLDAMDQAANPAVRFSSCFPFLGGSNRAGESLYVVPPRHVWPPPASTKVRWKSARFVPLSVVEDLLSGKAPNEDAWAVDSGSESLISSSAPAGSGLFRASVRSSAAIDRHGNGAAPHSTACLEFTSGSGLWFIAAFSDDAAASKWSDRLRGALRLLADSGFGGERSRGWGRAEMPEIVEGTLPQILFKPTETAADKAHWMLSLLHPDDADQIDWQRGSYSLTTRSGRIDSPDGGGELKKATRMVSEGSVLVAPSEPRGGAPDVAPEGFAHPVYRAGFGLSLAVPLAVTVRPGS